MDVPRRSSFWRGPVSEGYLVGIAFVGIGVAIHGLGQAVLETVLNVSGASLNRDLAALSRGAFTGLAWLNLAFVLLALGLGAASIGVFRGKAWGRKGLLWTCGAFVALVVPVRLVMLGAYPASSTAILGDLAIVLPYPLLAFLAAWRAGPPDRPGRPPVGWGFPAAAVALGGMSLLALSALIRLDALVANATGNRGVARENRGDLAGAAADYGAALRIDPGSAFFHLRRGSAKAAMGDPEGALEDWRRSLELNPREPEAYYRRARVRHERGERDAAASDLEMALKTAPAGWPLREAAVRLLGDVRSRR